MAEAATVTTGQSQSGATPTSTATTSSIPTAGPSAPESLCDTGTVNYITPKYLKDALTKLEQTLTDTLKGKLERQFKLEHRKFQDIVQQLVQTLKTVSSGQQSTQSEITTLLNIIYQERDIISKQLESGETQPVSTRPTLAQRIADFKVPVQKTIEAGKTQRDRPYKSTKVPALHLEPASRTIKSERTVPKQPLPSTSQQQIPNPTSTDPLQLESPSEDCLLPTVPYLGLRTSPAHIPNIEDSSKSTKSSKSTTKPAKKLSKNKKQQNKIQQLKIENQKLQQQLVDLKHQLNREQNTPNPSISKLQDRLSHVMEYNVTQSTRLEQQDIEIQKLQKQLDEERLKNLSAQLDELNNA